MVSVSFSCGEETGGIKSLKSNKDVWGCGNQVRNGSSKCEDSIEARWIYHGRSKVTWKKRDGVHGQLCGRYSVASDFGIYQHRFNKQEHIDISNIFVFKPCNIS
jgi:hypothetical protein